MNIKTRSDIENILELHSKWLKGEKGGKRADFSDADLFGFNFRRFDLRYAIFYGANLYGANLSDANLCDADFSYAILSNANLSDANLCDADFSYAILSNANLSGANLSGANFSFANLSGANFSLANLSGADFSYAILSNASLSGANLSDAKFRDTNLRGANFSLANLSGADFSLANLSGADFSYAILSNANLSGAKNIESVRYDANTSFFALQCPEEGSFVGWKKVEEDYIVKLLIPEDAKRSSATSRKCRASKATVLEIYDRNGNIMRDDFIGHSKKDYNFIYRKGETVIPDSYDEDRWNECSHGIHFFITRKEAELY